mmetsp:Transcript_53613/g.64552  ORF Transcript_53613/g.64552 Transcript_53613/m.64552 type:complete len:167 (+) Transcript_53613:59-559(+)
MPPYLNLNRNATTIEIIITNISSAPVVVYEETKMKTGAPDHDEEKVTHKKFRSGEVNQCIITETIIWNGDIIFGQCREVTCSTQSPIIAPSDRPTESPTDTPSLIANFFPSEIPSNDPTVTVSAHPTASPSKFLSSGPSHVPSVYPTVTLSEYSSEGLSLAAALFI